MPPGTVSWHEADLKSLTRIAQKIYDEKGEQRPYLTDDEVANLAIRRGSLTAQEIAKLPRHERKPMD